MHWTYGELLYNMRLIITDAVELFFNYPLTLLIGAHIS